MATRPLVMVAHEKKDLPAIFPEAGSESWGGPGGTPLQCTSAKKFIDRFQRSVLLDFVKSVDKVFLEHPQSLKTGFEGSGIELSPPDQIRISGPIFILKVPQASVRPTLLAGSNKWTRDETVID